MLSPMNVSVILRSRAAKYNYRGQIWNEERRTVWWSGTNKGMRQVDRMGLKRAIPLIIKARVPVIQEHQRNQCHLTGDEDKTATPSQNKSEQSVTAMSPCLQRKEDSSPVFTQWTTSDGYFLDNGPGILLIMTTYSRTPIHHSYYTVCPASQGDHLLSS